MMLARTVAALLLPPSQNDQQRRRADLHRAGAKAGERADAERSGNRRPAVIAPAGGERGQATSTTDDEPAQQISGSTRPAPSRRVAAPAQPATETGRLRANCIAASARIVNGKAADRVDQQQRRRRDPRPVHRRDQRHINQRRAEAGKAAHQAGQGGNRHRAMEAGVGDGVGTAKICGIGHGTSGSAAASLGGRGGRVFGPEPFWPKGGARGYQRAMGGHPIRILGIDPGLRRTGWGLVEADGNRLIYVACGSVETSERADARRPAGGHP